jgi:hypothetical protein
MKNSKQYYKELGKMVYAVAIADGVVSETERETLRNFVLKNLVSHEQDLDSSGMNKAFYVDFEFDDSVEQHRDSNEAMRSYVNFVHSNFETGDEELMHQSLALLDKVAEAYSRAKEKELVKNVLKEINDVYKIS